jgi:hypothetical protein
MAKDGTEQTIMKYNCKRMLLVPDSWLGHNRTFWRDESEMYQEVNVTMKQLDQILSIEEVK